MIDSKMGGEDPLVTDGVGRLIGVGPVFNDKFRKVQYLN